MNDGLGDALLMAVGTISSIFLLLMILARLEPTHEAPPKVLRTPAGNDVAPAEPALANRPATAL